MHFFLKNSKTFVVFDTLTFNTTKINAQVNEIQGSASSICPVSKNEVFINGGYSYTHLHNCYLINNKTGETKYLPANRKRAGAQAILYSRRIYVFGGNEKVQLKCCDMFNLDSLSWKSLSDLPRCLTSTSSVIFRENEFMIVGTELPRMQHICPYHYFLL